MSLVGHACRKYNAVGIIKNSTVLQWFLFQMYGKQFNVRSEVLTAVWLRTQVFWDMMLCPGVSGFTHSFEKLGTTHPTKQHHISIYLNPQSI
jgi:hypothetical protein